MSDFTEQLKEIASSYTASPVASEALMLAACRIEELDKEVEELRRKKTTNISMPWLSSPDKKYGDNYSIQCNTTKETYAN